MNHFAVIWNQPNLQIYYTLILKKQHIQGNGKVKLVSQDVYTKGTPKYNSKRHIYTSVHSSTVYNGQGMGAT